MCWGRGRLLSRQFGRINRVPLGLTTGPPLPHLGGEGARESWDPGLEPQKQPPAETGLGRGVSLSFPLPRGPCSLWAFAGRCVPTLAPRKANPSLGPWEAGFARLR